MVQLKSAFLRSLLPPVVCCWAIAFAQNAVEVESNKEIYTPATAQPFEIQTPVFTTPAPAVLELDSAGSNELSTEPTQDFSLSDGSELFDDETYDPDSAGAQKLRNDLHEPLILDETILYFDKESRSVYQNTEKQLRQCSKLPVSYIWKNFSPFFDYKKDGKFVEFASLLLAIWRAESNFAKPNNGVIVQPNCRNKKAKVVSSLGGRSLKKDLISAARKEKNIQKQFLKCRVKLADFGSLQWNNHWRLSQKTYRKEIERALLLTTQYSKNSLMQLKMSEINLLVKYNSHALYVLGALSMKDNAHRPVKLVRNYNSNRGYQNKVLRWRGEYVALLNSSDKCSFSNLRR